jgi:hypothetical protein
MQRSRFHILIVVLALFVAACGAGDEPAGSGLTTTVAQQGAEGPTEPTAAPDSPVPSGDQPATDVGAETPDRAPIEGPAAADFTLALGDGSSFVMSEATKPVYLVFWAEW